MPKSMYEKDLPIERSRPFNTLLVKEIQRYNKLICAIKANLAATRDALEGHRQHDSITEETFECLQTEKTPKEWIKYAYPCHPDITLFIANLKLRVEYIKELAQQFKNQVVTVRRFWMPGFFNPKNFLSTLMSVVSRQEKISLERLHIKYRIMKNSEMVPMKFLSSKKSCTFYIYGMWLYGAKWDQEKDSICDLEPNDLTGNEIPTL